MQRLLPSMTTKLVLGAALALSASLAVAHDRVNWSISIGAPFPAPVIYSPPPVVYVQPQPVYVRPQPVYVEPAPVYGGVYVNGYAPGYYRDYERREWHHDHHWKHHRHDWND